MMPIYEGLIKFERNKIKGNVLLEIRLRNVKKCMKINK